MAKILLAEDDNNLREIYGTRLLAEGYDIVSAPDGEAALQMAVKERPDLILSDVMMPRISGFEMIDILRSQDETKGIKVIVMTALSTDGQREKGEALGVDKYLVKSQVGIEDVVAAVHDVLHDAGMTMPAPASNDPNESIALDMPLANPASASVNPPAETSIAEQVASTPQPVYESTPEPTPAPQPESEAMPTLSFDNDILTQAANESIPAPVAESSAPAPEETSAPAANAVTDEEVPTSDELPPPEAY